MSQTPAWELDEKERENPLLQRGLGMPTPRLDMDDDDTMGGLLQTSLQEAAKRLPPSKRKKSKKKRSAREEVSLPSRDEL